ncbi:MAG: CvpA family protein [Oscillospiraceae bacterium]
MTTYSFIIDVVTALIGFFIIYGAYRKGFIRSIILVIGYVFSIFLAIYLSKIVSVYLFDNFIRTLIIENINNTVATNAGVASVAMVIPAILSKLPRVILNPILSSFGGENELIKLIDNQTGGILEKLGSVIADNVVAPIVLSLLEVISCLIIFILCTIIVKIIAKMFKGLYAIPIIGPINSILGGALGIVQTGIVFYLLALIISTVISLTANELPWINNQVMNSTYILRHFLY